MTRTIHASELLPGHVLHKLTGEVAILRVIPERGGVELLVRPATGRKGLGTGKEERILWFWANQGVVVGTDMVPVEAPCRPRRESAAESLSRARAAKAKAREAKP